MASKAGVLVVAVALALVCQAVPGQAKLIVHPTAFGQRVGLAHTAAVDSRTITHLAVEVNALGGEHAPRDLEHLANPDPEALLQQARNLEGSGGEDERLLLSLPLANITLPLRLRGIDDSSPPPRHRHDHRAAGPVHQKLARSLPDRAVSSSGDEVVHVRHGEAQVRGAHHKGGSFLDAQRVQIGTAELGQRPSADSAASDSVAQFRVRFHDRFAVRPVVLVSVVPGGAEGVSTLGPHPDVFAVTVSEISLSSFVVNVVRVDQRPHNAWEQTLFLDWVALEYPSDHPKARR